MSIIRLGECNKNMMHILVGGISKLIVNIILYLFPQGAKLNNHPFLLGINAGLGMSLAIIPYILVEKITKPKKEKILNNNKYIEDLKKRKSSGIKRERYLILFLCAFLDFTQKVLVFLFSYSIANNVWIFNIVFLNVFTSMLMNNPIYRHQLVSSGIMIFFGIALNVVNLYKMTVNDIPILFLSIFIEIIYSLAIVLAKYGMDHAFCSPFEITFYEGIMGLIMNIIFLIISTNVPLSPHFKYKNILKISDYKGKMYLDNFYTYIDNFDFTEFLLFTITMFGRVLFNLFSHLTIRYFTSSHVVFLLIMGEVTLDWSEKDADEVILTAIIFFIEFLMLLVFCEIIELNFCGLEVNTRRNIQERVKKEQYEDDDDDSIRESKDIWDGLELSSESSSSINMF